MGDGVGTGKGTGKSMRKCLSKLTLQQRLNCRGRSPTKTAIGFSVCISICVVRPIPHKFRGRTLKECPKPLAARCLLRVTPKWRVNLHTLNLWDVAPAPKIWGWLGVKNWILMVWYHSKALMRGEPKILILFKNLATIFFRNICQKLVTIFRHLVTISRYLVTIIGAGGKGPRQEIKIVKKCQGKNVKHYSTVSAQGKKVKNRQKGDKHFRHFATNFARHQISGPFFRRGQTCTFQTCTLFSARFLALSTSPLPSMPSFPSLLSIASLLSELDLAITSPKKGQAMQRFHEEQSAHSKGARLSPLDFWGALILFMLKQFSRT